MTLLRRLLNKKANKEIKELKALLKTVKDDRGFCYLETSTINKIVKMSESANK